MRALALVLGVSVVVLLVGLSVAPQALPGDTVRISHRVAAGVMVERAAYPDGAYLNGANTVQLVTTTLHATAPAPLTLPTDGLRLGLAYQRRLTLRASTPACVSIRGPPASA
jgi:hypothetical protein